MTITILAGWGPFVLNHCQPQSSSLYLWRESEPLLFFRLSNWTCPGAERTMVNPGYLTLHLLLLQLWTDEIGSPLRSSSSSFFYHRFAIVLRPLFTTSNERDQSRAFSSRLPLKKKESAFTLRKLAASDSSSLQFYLRLSLILFNSLQTYLRRKPVPRSLILSASPNIFTAHCSNSQAISRVSLCDSQHNC